MDANLLGAGVVFAGEYTLGLQKINSDNSHILSGYRIFVQKFLILSDSIRCGSFWEL